MPRFIFRRMAPALLALVALFPACVRDKVVHHYTLQIPTYQTLTALHQNMRTGTPTDLNYPGKICTYKNFLFISDASTGIHVIDNADPKSPSNLGFIPVFGNNDIAIRNDVLYADDQYGELVALDIRDPAHAKFSAVIPGMFNSYGATGPYPNPDSVLVVTGYTYKDTAAYGEGPNTSYYPLYSGICANCSMYSVNASNNSPGKSPNATGTTGSTARFALNGSYLYCLNGAPLLDVIDVSTPLQPKLLQMDSLGDYYSTMFFLNDHLLMGSTTGMYIYDVSNPASAIKTGSFEHVKTCDPVIAEGNTAYVTLRSGTTCGDATDELDVLDITNVNAPTLIKKYPLTNPRGLSKDGDLLLVCDGKDGLGTFRAASPDNISKLHQTGSLEANDVIASDGLAIVTAADGIYQFSYTTDGTLSPLSKLDVHAQD